MLCINVGTCCAIYVLNVSKFRHLHQLESKMMQIYMQAFINKSLENVMPKFRHLLNVWYFAKDFA